MRFPLVFRGLGATSVFVAVAGFQQGEREHSAQCVCPEGWECKREGLCVPPHWNTTAACPAAGPSPTHCTKLVNEALDAGRAWILAFSSSDSKESVASAESLINSYLKSWRATVDDILVRLEQARGELGQETYGDLQAILAHAWDQRPFQEVDLAKSQCNDGTERAAVDATHKRCFYNLVKVMSGAWVQRSWFPAKIVATQSQYIGAMARAADYVRRKTRHEMEVHCHILELFPNLKSTFFGPVKDFAESQFSASAKVLRLHLVKPLKESREEVAKEAGLQPSQVIFEDFIQVSTPFLEGTLPSPGEALDILLQATSTQEADFLGDKEKVFSILPDDVITLVAFGAQPNPGTLQRYTELLAKLGPLQVKNSKAASKGLHFIFADAGSPEWAEYSRVYNATSELAAAVNAHQEESGGRVRIVPLSHQLSQLRRLKGRSDLIITHGGTFAAGELLALARRGDQRHILIEVGGVEGLEASAQKRMAAESWWEREAWEKTAYLYMETQQRRNYRYLAKTLDATLTTTETLQDAWEDAGMKVGGFCPELGACSTQLFDGESACRTGSARCMELLPEVLAAARGWTLLFTASGGGGHMVAASVLGRRQAESWQKSMTAASQNLETIKDDMTVRAYEVLHLLVAKAQQAEPIVSIDMMSSPCTNLLGEHGLGVGKAFSSVWNLGQSLGSVKALTGMSKAQGLEDDVFRRQCQKYIRNVIGGNRLGRSSPPSSVLSCQPTQHAAIAAAIQELWKEAGAAPTLDIYLTELPTTHAVSFFDPLRSLSENSREAASHVRVHTVTPASGGVEAIAERTGLNASQVILEENMPVDERLQMKNLPGPGSVANITLEARTPRELQFLGRQTKVFNIEAEDSVTLVMLGSQPTVSTMRQYVEKFVQSTPRRLAANPSSLHWLFLAAGDPKQAAFEKLYDALADLADRFNFLQRMTDGRVRMVPFTRQSVTELESRSDVTLTRSGGITSGELLAMSRRGDRRQVLLHLEVPKDHQATEPDADSDLRADWEQLALKDSMIEWEMGNAKYLQQVLSATLITPKKLPALW